MGHRKQSAPKRGSLAYSPRRRISNIYGRIRAWPVHDGPPTVLGFAGFKVGMTHVVMREDRPHNPYLGQERVRPVTIIEAPPMVVVGARGYEKTATGRRVCCELWAKEVPKTLERYWIKKKDYDYEGKKKAFMSELSRVDELRVVLAAQPVLASVPQKKPIYNEYAVGGGTVEEQLNYVLAMMGKEIAVTDVFDEGDWVDSISASKGKGFQGPVKRWGIKILQHKTRKARRAVGSIGPWKPAHMSYTVPRAGQMGYHQRTEYNLKIVSIGESGRDITPLGGFNRYGVVRSSYFMVMGSVPGPSKRFIRFRRALRPSAKATEQKPELIYIDSVSS
ncbi:MAG: 50S ribosomal protein L3 [Candidatus Ranarchaeia archaeon]